MGDDELGGVQGGNAPDGGQNAPGPNPAWNDVLSVIPPELHDQVTPHFQKWDQSAHQRIEQVNQRIAQYEPYNAFLEHGIDAADLEQGLRLLYEVQNDPRKVYDALAKAYSLSAEAGNAPGNVTPNPTSESQTQQQIQDPRYDRLNQGLELVSKIILEDQQSKAEAQAQAELDKELAALKGKIGDFDEDYVLALMLQHDMSAEEAGQKFIEFRNGLLQSNPRPFAPNVMGSNAGGSGYPSQQIDPRKLDGKGTRNLVAQMLAAELANGN